MKNSAESPACGYGSGGWQRVTGRQVVSAVTATSSLALARLT